jgi:hypothetical protein
MILNQSTEDQEQDFSSPVVTRQPPPQVSEAEPDENPSFIKDLLLAPFRGAESAVRNTYGFVDFITGDALPDWDNNVLGTSKTTAGSIVEGTAQFLLPFLLPGVGAMSLAGRAGQVLGLAGKFGKVGTAAKAAVAGAAVDFSAFGAHEERLSNLLRDHTSLNDPITAYLAADENDSEIEGRFKNAIEGLGLGVLTEGLIHSLKNLKAIRQYQAGITKEADNAKFAKLAEDASSFSRDSLDKLKRGEQTIEPAKAPDGSIVTEPETKIESAKGTLEQEREAFADKARQLAEFDPKKYEGGQFYQSPDKAIGRYINTDKDALTLIDYTARLLREQDAGKASADALAIPGAPRLEGSKAYEGKASLDKEAASRLASITGVDPESVVSVMRAREAQFSDGRYWAEASTKLTVALASEVKEYAKAALAGKGIGTETAEQTMLRAVAGQQKLAQMVAISKGFGTIAGRALRDRQFIKNVEVEALDVVRGMLDSQGGDKYVRQQLQILMTAADKAGPLDTAKAIVEQAKVGASLGDRLLRAHNEYWINSILSGTKTSVVNALGNTFTTFYQPFEQALGSAFVGDIKGARASLKQYHYLLTSARESMNFAFRSLRENQAFLYEDGKLNDVVKGPWIDASKLGNGPESKGLVAEASSLAKGGEGNLLSHALNFMGETIRLPQRFLLSGDEFFKQINYRAAAQTELYYRGMSQNLEGEALHSFVADGFSKTITDGGRRYSEAGVIREAISQAEAQGLNGAEFTAFVRDFKNKNWNPSNSALKDAFEVSDLAKGVSDEATFTLPLGKIGRGVQEFAQSHPLFQLVLPFVRTPTNIIKYYGQRVGFSSVTPGLDRLQVRNMTDLASANPLVRQRAIGRIGVGQMMVTAGGMAAMEGAITGAGPRNQDERRALTATGWQPYSLKFDTDEGPMYVSYQRLDPFANFLAVMADWGEQARRMDPHRSADSEKILTATAVAMANNVANKTYLASLSQLMDAITAPDRKAAPWARSRVASYVPSLLAQFRNAGEEAEEMKELRSFSDAIMNRLPGQQGNLESKRNVVGEPIDSVLAQTPFNSSNPITLSRDKGDKLFDELAQLNAGLKAPSPVLFNSIDLVNDHQTADGRSAYDRYQELAGQVSINGQTLRQTLTRLVGSAQYKKLSLTGEDSNYDSPRLREVRSVIERYRKVALRQLQKEVPSVGQAVKAYQTDQRSLRMGREATALAALLDQR